MPRIFLSYRRTDSSTVSGRIYDHLVREFSDDNVFKDVYDIPAGSDFRTVIRDNIYSCNVQLVIIGTGWVDARSADGARRLENPDDFVRIEVETGLTCPTIRVIPVLVSGAPMPSPAQLPESIRDITFRNAVFIRDDPDFPDDMNRLIRSLKGGKEAERMIALRQRRGLMAGVMVGAVALLAVVLFFLSRNATQARLAQQTGTAVALLNLQLTDAAASTATQSANSTATAVAVLDERNTATALALISTSTLTSTPTVTPTEIPPTDVFTATPTRTQPAATRDADDDAEASAVTLIREGDALQTEGNYQAALDRYTRAIAIDPNNAEAYISRASVLRTLGVNLDQAMSDAAAAYARGWTNYLYHDEVARIYYAKGDYNAATLSFTMALQMETYALGYLGRAYAYHAMGDNTRALSDLNQSIALDPNDPAAYEERGWVQRDLGRNGDAIRDFTSAIEKGGESAWVYVGRGSAYRDTSRFDKAIADFDQAIELDPDLAEAYYERGYTYELMNYTVDARDDYRSALALDSTYVNAHYHLVLLDLLIGEPQEALDHARRVVQLAPDDADSYSLLGDVYYYVARYDEALEQYRRYAELAGDSAELSYLQRINELENSE